MDGPLFGQNQDIGFDKPFMFLFAKPFKMLEDHPNHDYYDQVIKQNLKRITKLYNALTNNVYHIILKEADHMSFSDWNFITKSQSEGKINHQKMNRLTRVLLVNFFDKYLKGKSLPVLEPITNVKEVEVKFRVS